MKSKIIISALFIGATAIIYSCETRTYDEISGGAILHPTYAKNIKPVIDNNCVSCHSSKGTSPDLTTYNGVKDNAASIYNQIESGKMPQSSDKLSGTTIQTFQNWINDGTPQN